ncbi:phospholipase a2 precursor-like protein [Dermatophagoides farinae]|uniref:Phospholipase a2-like protein n=1 Tax=Dermatophagoides farinae TaxID=6954 RepID=A0A9D4NUZ5_DERFA|nr:phospholipase a2 precursor-like protein [Dermatophagoides farinae]
MVVIFISKSQNAPLIVDKREDHILIEIIDKIQRYSPVVCCGSPSESRPTCKHYCCDKPDKEDKPKPTTHKPLDSGGNSSPKSTKKPPINNVPQPSTYVVCFSFENILTIIEFRHDNHFIHDCVIFDQTIEERKQQSHYYMEYYAAKNRTFFSHQIDFNIMLLMIRSCTMNAFEQQQQLQVTHNTGNINVCGFHDIAIDYWDLGKASSVDICCREHDHCPIRILPNEKQYGIDNGGKFTLSLCQCEQLFYDCLDHESHSSYGQEIKRIYFNLLRLKCLEPIDCQAKWIYNNNKWELKNRDKPCADKFRTIKFKNRHKLFGDQNDDDGGHKERPQKGHDDDDDDKLPDQKRKTNKRRWNKCRSKKYPPYLHTHTHHLSVSINRS